MNQEFLLRSLMFVPGHNLKLLKSAIKSNADALLPDLEDSVQPKSTKSVARSNIRSWAESGKFKDFHVFPRINDRESGELLKDLRALTIPGIDGFMYPKSVKGEDIYFIDKLLEVLEYEKGIPVGQFKLIPLIETTGAVLKAQEICKASKRVIAIAFGCEDFISDLGGIHDAQGKSIFTARSIIAMAARSANVVPVDTVHINVHDLNDLKDNLSLSKNLGFEGMLILHPKEIPLAHQYFSPSKEEVEEATEMIHLAEKANKEGKGVTISHGKFIGPPMVRKAKKVLDRHHLIINKSKS